MVMIYRSRFTPGLANGADVSFDRGEVIKYRLKNGVVVEATVDSDLMSHDEARGDGTGYECIFHDNGQRGFAERTRIVGWEGKQP